jgi:hypothetical protein
MNYQHILERLEIFENKLYQQDQMIYNLQKQIDPYLYLPEWNIFIPKNIKVLEINSMHTCSFSYEYSIYNIYDIYEELFDESNPNHFIDSNGNFKEKWMKMTIFIPINQSQNNYLNAETIQHLHLHSISIEKQKYIQNIHLLSRISSLESIKIYTENEYSIEQLKEMIPQLQSIQCSSTCRTFKK